MSRKKGKKVEGMDRFQEFLEQRVRTSGTAKQYLSCVNVLKISISEMEKMSDEKVLNLFNNKILEKGEDKIELNRSYHRRYAYKYLLKYLNRPHLIDMLAKISPQPRRQKSKNLPFGVVKGMVNEAYRSDYKLLIMMLSDVGCRISALMDAKKEDVSYDGPRAVLTITEKKTGTISAKYLSKPTTKVLKGYLSKKGGSDFIFPFRTTERSRQILRKFRNNVSPHWFRHSRAVTLLRQGYGLIDVAEQLDHRSLESTRKYLQSAGVSSKKIMERHEPKW